MNVLLLTTLAGAAIPVGAGAAWVEHIRSTRLREEFRHGMTAFGGGVVLAAVALVLAPYGMAHLPPAVAAFSFVAGAVVFMRLDMWVHRKGVAAGQVMAMVMDFAPEAIALGASCAKGGSTAALLAMLIGLQNVPEAFGSYRELVASKRSPGAALLWLTMLAPVGPIAGIAGYYLLAEREGVVAVIMLVAAGGILYLTFQDIAPEARLRNRWAPALGAVLGFLVGMVGRMWLGG